MLAKVLRRIDDGFLWFYTAIAATSRGVLLARDIPTRAAVALPAPFRRSADTISRRYLTISIYRRSNGLPGYYVLGIL